MGRRRSRWSGLPLLERHRVGRGASGCSGSNAAGLKGLEEEVRDVLAIVRRESDGLASNRRGVLVSRRPHTGQPSSPYWSCMRPQDWPCRQPRRPGRHRPGSTRLDGTAALRCNVTKFDRNGSGSSCAPCSWLLLRNAFGSATVVSGPGPGPGPGPSDGRGRTARHSSAVTLHRFW